MRIPGDEPQKLTRGGYDNLTQGLTQISNNIGGKNMLMFFVENSDLGFGKYKNLILIISGGQK